MYSQKLLWSNNCLLKDYNTSMHACAIVQSYVPFAEFNKWLQGKSHLFSVLLPFLFFFDMPNARSKIKSLFSEQILIRLIVNFGVCKDCLGLNLLFGFKYFSHFHSFWNCKLFKWISLEIFLRYTFSSHGKYLMYCQVWFLFFFFFRTYDEVEFRTGPYLNVIIGPNGTGKSAIVCAICLGLAGKTSWLGRASDPKDFIKYGAQSAKTEIELWVWLLLALCEKQYCVYLHQLPNFVPPKFHTLLSQYILALEGTF